MNLLPPTVSLYPSGCSHQTQGLSRPGPGYQLMKPSSPAPNSSYSEPTDIQITSSKDHWRGYFVVSFKNQSSVAFSLNLSCCIFKHR